MNAGPLTLVRGPCFWGGRGREREPLSQSRQSGFAVLELAIVIAATLLIAALGVSIYRTHSVRAEIAASIEEAGPAQHLVVAAFRENGAPPADAAATGIDATVRDLLSIPHVESLEVLNGRIDLRFGADADSAIAGKTLSLTPFETADHEVVWVCGGQPPDVGLEPLGFAAGGPQAVSIDTSIEDRYLPRSCRCAWAGRNGLRSRRPLT